MTTGRTKGQVENIMFPAILQTGAGRLIITSSGVARRQLRPTAYTND